MELGSSPTQKLERWAFPIAIVLSMAARWEIDLSPETIIVPSSLCGERTISLMSINLICYYGAREVRCSIVMYLIMIILKRFQKIM